jgi:hypothetical protein
MRDHWHSTAAAASSEPMMQYLFLNLLPVGLFRFAGRGSGHAAVRARSLAGADVLDDGRYGETALVERVENACSC